MSAVGRLGRNQWTVVIAVIAVRVVKMVGDAIVDVVTVRHRLMAAAQDRFGLSAT